MRTPDIEGRGVKAWRINWAARPDVPAAVAGWILHCTWAHPAWNHWLISVVHLRDVEGAPPANRIYPEAAFEFMIAALDPACVNKIDPDRARGWRYLVPIDVCHQFHGVSDEDAARICDDAVRAIAAGRISPDGDYRTAWNQSIDATVRDYRTAARARN
jgi:hypothetical protein